MVIKNFFLLALFPLLLTACFRPAKSQREFALGTFCVINLYESGTNKLYSRMFSRIREIDTTMSAFPGEFEGLLNDNTINDPNFGDSAMGDAVSTLVSGALAINRQAGIAPVKVRADLILVLETALRYAELSGGAFDPTIGPLVKLWGIGTETERIPTDAEIAAALELVNFRDLIIDRNSGTAFLRRKGMEIDLGGIAKGYAADEAARIAREGRVRRGIIDLGGNILALGWRWEKKKDSTPWRIGVQNPFSARGESIGFLEVHDTSVVTSGVYERFFDNGGTRYHHILSTTNGYPVDNGLLAVTIVTERSMEADALSTAVFALGFERGKALIDSIPNAEAVFVFADRSVKITEGLSGIFTLTDNEFGFLESQRRNF
jgi:thiamine biosynthesis lipoprotein